MKVKMLLKSFAQIVFLNLISSGKKRAHAMYGPFYIG